MAETELALMSLNEQAHLLRRREISPVELVQRYLDRIEKWDHVLRSYITVCADSALARARKAESEIVAGDYRGLLHGIPFGVKDQMHVAGVPTTLGTRALTESEMMANEDATVVKRLDAQGAIFIGKHNLHELGKGGTSEFSYGQPRNPWNPAFDASSSSTGSGIAAAAGLCSFSLGEDTGGSIRGPAAASGIAGVRPTFGRVSRHGAVMAAYTSDTIGPLARRVADCAVVLEAIAGHDPADPLSSARPVPNYLDGLEGDLRGVKIGIIGEVVRSHYVDAETAENMDAAATVLRSLGATVEEMNIPHVRFSVPLQILTSDADVAAIFIQKYLRKHWAKLDRNLRSRFAAASLIPTTAYNRAMRARVLVRRQILESFENYDALLIPSSSSAPKPINPKAQRMARSDDLVDDLIRWRICEYPFSIANVPAISVPSGFARNGLPLGVQFAARPFQETLMLRIAHAYEQATSWHRQHPALETTLAAQS